MLKFNKGIVAPQLAAEGFATHYVAGVLQQRQENLEGFLRNPDSHAGFIDVAGSRVDFKRTETVPRDRIAFC